MCSLCSKRPSTLALAQAAAEACTMVAVFSYFKPALGIPQESRHLSYPFYLLALICSQWLPSSDVPPGLSVGTSWNSPRNPVGSGKSVLALQEISVG